MRATEIMTTDPVVCTMHCSAKIVAGVMKELDIGILPVVENLNARRLIGVITDRDLALRVVAAGRNPATVTAQECMTADPVTCYAEDDAHNVLALMAEHQVRRIPVVDGNNCILGVVSISDLIRHVAVNARDLYMVTNRICEHKLKAWAEAA